MGTGSSSLTITQAAATGTLGLCSRSSSLKSGQAVASGTTLSSSSAPAQASSTQVSFTIQELWHWQGILRSLPGGTEEEVLEQLRESLYFARLSTDEVVRLRPLLVYAAGTVLGPGSAQKTDYMLRHGTGMTSQRKLGMTIRDVLEYAQTVWQFKEILDDGVQCFDGVLCASSSMVWKVEGERAPTGVAKLSDLQKVFEQLGKECWHVVGEVERKAAVLVGPSLGESTLSQMLVKLETNGWVEFDSERSRVRWKG